MEDTLWVIYQPIKIKNYEVLILVLMEDTLWESNKMSDVVLEWS